MGSRWSGRFIDWLENLTFETEGGKQSLHTFRLDVERPHHLQGVRVRLAVKVALHNFCIWMVVINTKRLRFKPFEEAMNDDYTGYGKSHD